MKRMILLDLPSVLSRAEFSKAELFKERFQTLQEEDVFNQLANTLSLADQVLFRAYYKAMHQMGVKNSAQESVEALNSNPILMNHLKQIFDRRFAKSNSLKTEHRARLNAEAIKTFHQDLTKVGNKINRQVLLNYLTLILATVRTNFFQHSPHPNSALEVLCFKFECEKTPFLPLPHPLYEIFVYSPRVEGCHLRSSKISRGGIRWCETEEDYRYEILNLMKTQDLKNSIIVPTGAKGGFVCKQYQVLKQNGAPKEALNQEVKACYQIFITALLKLTDNLEVQKVIPSNLSYGYDEADPYLVVAADKGTANFSDLANQISESQNFWLRDAFASGGSRGYNHRQLGITSRGAWVSLRRHFFEQGIDCQAEPITVVGVGDMSGDVFGNSMLLSPHLRLVAAFNQHFIFIDPNPDPLTSYRERQRLFQKDGSNWSDYQIEMLSKGGKIFPREQKVLELTPEIQDLLKLDSEQLLISPTLLIQNLLTLSVDLLWFGGIGTFVKAAVENHADLHNPQNDDVRINASQVRAKVIGEGANLALTQAARIEYALKGGAVNTDALDNSAGVSCSDHEVNLKLLFSSLNLRTQQQTLLLKDCLAEVTDLVLFDNQAQTLLLSLESAAANTPIAAKQDLKQDETLIDFLEQQPNLHFKAAFERLPSGQEFEKRKRETQPLTRPEKAILMAYTKNYLSTCFLDSLKNTPEVFQQLIPLYQSYFPNKIQSLFKEELLQHPLKLEISALLLSNQVVNKMGIKWCIQTAKAWGKTEFEVALKFFKTWGAKGYEMNWQSLALKTFSPNPQPFYYDLLNLREDLLKSLNL